jgi:hypothetical protein
VRSVEASVKDLAFVKDMEVCIPLKDFEFWVNVCCWVLGHRILIWIDLD